MKDTEIKGISLRILSGLLFTAMALCVKMASGHAPLGQIVFARSFFALAPLVLFLWLRGEWPHGLATRRPLGHLLRSGLGAAGMFASFATLARLSVAEATMLAYLSPLFTALIATVFLSERLTRARILGIGLGLLGVALATGPTLLEGEAVADGQLVGYGLGVLTALLIALALNMVRRLSQTETAGSIAFYFILVSMLGGLVTLPYGWVWTDGQTLVFLVLSGLFGGGAHIAMTLAFRYAEASRLAPFEYLALVWAVLADQILFATSLPLTTLAAIGVILMGSIMAASEGRGARKAV